MGHELSRQERDRREALEPSPPSVISTFSDPKHGNLPPGMVGLIKTAQRAESLGIEVDAAWGLVLEVIEGKIRGAGTSTRLRAAMFLLEQKMLSS